MKLAQVYNQQRKRIMANTNFIYLHLSGVHNSQSRNDFLKIHRFSSVILKLAILTARVIYEFISFRRKDETNDE